MALPYVGEIRMFAGNFAPVGWAFCRGQMLPISENETLFQLIGTTYGGDGQSTFALPDLQGRIPIHNGTGPSGTQYLLGEHGGQENVSLTLAQVPQHAHSVLASAQTATAGTPSGNVPAAASPSTAKVYTFSQNAAAVPMAPEAVSTVGGAQPHGNLMPFLALNFIISLFGIFPSQT
jgi:microcystin-dependent protein